MTAHSAKSDLARQGQAATAVRARPGMVGFALVRQTPVLALLVGVPGLAAMVEQERALAIALLLPAGILAGLGIWSRRLSSSDELRRIEAVATLALIFVLSAVLAVPAFMVLGLNPLDAFFEATSGITTTGLSVAAEAESWPISAHLLRAWMQWCGGVVMAVAGVALLMDSARAARALGREAVSGGDYLASTRAKARIVLTGYGAITVVALLLSVPLFPGWWEGPMIALAAVSTGGFTPRDTSLADYSPAAQVFTLALCVATSISLLFYALAWRRGTHHAIRSGTVAVTLGLVAGGVGVYALLHGLTQGWSAEDLLAGVFNQVSAQTTAGFSTAPVKPGVPLMFLFIAAMVLGGDVGSTTGGIKAARTSMLFRMIALVFLRLRLPDRALSHLKIGNRRADAEAIVFAAALLAIYLVSALVFWAALCAAGFPPVSALFDAVSALSGVGLSTGVIGPDLPAPLKALAIAAMLLGRLEFFVMISLFLPSTWIARR